MDIGTIIEIVLILGLGAGIFYQLNKKKPEENREQPLREEIAQLKAELQAEKSEKDRLIGQGRQTYAEITNIKKDKETLTEKNDELKKQVSEYNAEQRRREAEFQDRLNKLEEAKNSLEEEKKRIRREDEERQAKLLADRDRVWAQHETDVVSLLNSLCKSPEFNFNTYDNNNLPEDFDGKLKPDFMLEFLDQYVIFDAKTTKSDNLQVYINDQVKKTAAKVQGNPKVYNAIFLVVPADGIAQLKKYHFFEDGYSFYVITPEAIGPILASFKKIESYEFAEQMNPQDRENIINVIAELDQHINFTNAAHLLLVQRGINSREKMRGLDSSIQEEIDLKREKMRLTSLKPTDLKKFMMNTHVQQKAIREHISPHAEIDQEDIVQISNLLEGDQPR